MKHGWRLTTKGCIAIVAVFVLAGVVLATACSDRRILHLLFDGVPDETGSVAATSEVGAREPVGAASGEGISGVGRRGFVLLDANSPKAHTVSSNHASFATNCGACHQQDAVVSDDKCLTCHNDNAHQPGVAMTVACGGCHQEHGGQTADLTRMPAAMCMSCHGEGPFEEMHPEFALVDDAKAAATAKFTTGLDMPHGVHLRLEVPEGPREGQPFMCMDCHELDSTRPDTFMPPTYEKKCMVCHEVEAHGYVPAVEWSELAADLPQGAARDAVLYASPRWRAFQEGQGIDDETAAALEEVREALGDEDIAECFRCHSFVERENFGEAVLVAADTQFRTSWFQRSRFKHSAHFFVECEHCHDVEAAGDKSGALMLPGVDTCTECHNAGGVSNACSTCHTFHTRGDRQPVDEQRSRRVRDLLQLAGSDS